MYLWQLPQNLLGLLLRAIYNGNDSEYEGSIVRRSKNMLGGISLGKYIIISQWAEEDTVKHEYGHCLQSKYLGWLYLLVIGLMSGIWALLYGPVIDPDKHDYYSFFTERWANKLGGLSR